MHHDRITAKLNPNKRESRTDDVPPWRVGVNADDEPRDHGWGKAQLAFGARQQEALKQIREIRAGGD